MQQIGQFLCFSNTIRCLMLDKYYLYYYIISSY